MRWRRSTSVTFERRRGPCGGPVGGLSLGVCLCCSGPAVVPALGCLALRVMLGASLREWHRGLALAQWRAFLVAGLWLLFGFL